MLKQWWSLSSDDVLKELSSSPRGLSDDEVKKRLSIYGHNILPSETTSLFSIVWRQIKSPLVWVLVLISFFSVLFDGYIDAFIILLIVAFNVVLGCYQEYSADRSIARLRKLITHPVKVMRNSAIHAIESHELVPGDIVILEAGNSVPADIRLIQIHEFITDESVVTGESVPVDKTNLAIKKQDPLPQDLKNYALMGSLVVNGSATGIVIGTASHTYFGRLAKEVEKKRPPSEFEKNLFHFGDVILKIIIVTSIIVFAINVLLGKPAITSFMFSIALAVGLIPEALPMIITVALSQGAHHLSKSGVITKRLESLETLGNVDVICVDKTGTLTENNMHVKEIFSDFHNHHHVLELASACTQGSFNPIDHAVRDACSSHQGHHYVEPYNTLHTIPFDFTRRRMSVIVKSKSSHLLVVKGAPESVLAECTHEDGHSKIKKKKWVSLYQKLNNEGYHTIAIAYKPFKSSLASVKDESNLIFAGLIAFEDPPKKGVRETLDKARKLNVLVKIITGDNPKTAKSLANQVGLSISDEDIITGDILAKLNSNDLLVAVETMKIFARVTPEQKELIILSLKQKGHIVAFLGDGVNDAPALHVADVGISVNSAADVAKETADIVLQKKSLHAIIEGIEGGRKIFSNIMKYILFTMAGNFGNLYTVAASSAFLPFLPLTTVQILLSNLISDIPMLGVGGDNVDPDELQTPKRWVLAGVVTFGAMLGWINTLCTLLMIVLLHGFEEKLFQTGLFVEIVLAGIFILFSVRTKRFLFSSRPVNSLLFFSVVGIIATFAVVYLPINTALGFKPLSIVVIVQTFLIIALFMVLTEGAKLFYYKHMIRRA